MILDRRTFRIIVLTVWVFLLVGLLAVPVWAQGSNGSADDQYIDQTCDDFATQQEAQGVLDDNGDPTLLDADGDGTACNEDDPQSGTCENPQEVETFGPETEDQITDPFEITGDTFRISYEVTSQASAGGFPILDITVLDEDEFPVDFIFETEEGADSENVLAGPGTFTLQIEADDASYVVTVEDCVESDQQNPSSDDNNDDNNDANDDEDDNNDNDIINVPDKDLPETGGVPLLGVALFVFAGAGLLTAVVRRGR